MGCKERKESIERLRENFNPEQISENIPGSMYVAYSVNKGQELSICIREKDTEKFIDDNNILNKGDKYVVTGGVPIGIAGTTNFVFVQKVE